MPHRNLDYAQPSWLPTSEMCWEGGVGGADLAALFLPPTPPPRRFRVAMMNSWLDAEDSIEEVLEREERAGEGGEEEGG